MRKNFAILTFLVCFFWPVTNAHAATIKVSDNAFLDIHGYVQTWLNMPIDFDAPDGQPAIGSDFYLKRVRLLFSGQISKNINFFIGTLNSGMGINGDMTARTLIADAWMEFVVNDSLKINVGLLKLPFSRHMQISGAKLHGIDFHGQFLKRSGGIGHRDMGIQARGLLMDKHIDYRFAVVDGQEPGGENDAPRFVGRVGYNVFDAEPGYFWADTYLGKKKILSFGLSFDIQSGVGGTTGDELFYAFAVDALADIPMGKDGIVANLNAYHFGPGGINPEGNGFWADFGYRIGKIEPLIAFEWYEPDKGAKGKRKAIMTGINWWIHGYNANIKFQFGTEKLDGASEWSNTVAFQTQLLF